ncbi:hypothetical protein BD309DRAFT_1003718 [Dichomitus squalens]|uniref:Uncharacterized protein n=1 Tax=Dichomitus squalens TaxID=114155 RepID=A0A4Q9PKH1_9APHY|nr:hypothetical protein BD309DRAFT_1003718 [Dichomitus squalens]TBU54653.1 hypothetical protein BD310DRAFT_827614 [Dichomitus squalens]
MHSLLRSSPERPSKECDNRIRVLMSKTWREIEFCDLVQHPRPIPPGPIKGPPFGLPILTKIITIPHTKAHTR